MDNELAKIFDKIAEKFGIVVNGSQDNIYPYIRDILQRYRTASIVQDAVTIGILGLLILSAILTLKSILRRKSIEDSYDEFIFAIFTVFYFFGLAILLLITICKIYDLTSWIFVPEMQFVKELAKLK